jgi:hypothetical protein
MLQISSSRSSFILLGGVALSVAAILCSRRIFLRPKRTLNRDELHRVLQQLCAAFVACLAEPAQCVQRADMLSSQRRADHDSRFGLNDEEMSTLLMQGGVGEKMEQIQEKVFKEANVTQEELEKATEHFGSDEETSKLIESLDNILACYVDGGMPVNPRAEVIRNEKQTLATLREVVELKEERISEFLSSKTTEDWPTPEIAAELARIAKQTEAEVCKNNDITEDDLLASVAIGTNKSRNFRKSLVTLLFKHQSIPRVVDHRS